MNSLALFIDGPSRVPYLVKYWDSDGLRNLGKTGYMNASLQCMLASLPVARFFTEIKGKALINMLYSKGTKYLLTSAFANLVAELVQADPVQVWTPYTFWKTMGELGSKYQRHHQHDAQEFFSFLLDGIHKDINRSIIPFSLSKRAEERKTLEKLSGNAASKREWYYWKQRNDSLIVDYFHGQSLDYTSTIYNTFSLLHLPIPHSSSTQKISIRACFNALFETNTLEQSNAWFCPHCQKGRRAGTRLCLTRLPPILVIHLKRFEPCYRVSGKINNFVDFPLNGLDLTDKEDPRVQVPPYKYDLYAVTNHDGTLTNGHCTGLFLQ
ncbi:hypothetical protein DL96DRAFT_1697243 [Flagelloscypha sp. PMI_526]|nr:hypothetical protein DL96DRAFT_1697243 [Flagelloscypha sp. PMI_526]